MKPDSSPNLDSPAYVPEFTGRLGVQQRVLPSYRVEFFNTLARACPGGLSVFAGQPQRDESIAVADHLGDARYVAVRNLHFGSVHQPYYFCWQGGLLQWLEDWQPDVLVLEANPRNISSYRAARWMHRRGRAVIGWGLGAPGARLDQAGFGGRLRGSGRRGFYRIFNGMIAYSQRGAEEYRALGFPSQRVFVAPNAVMHRPGTDAPSLRPAGYAPLTVLFVGRLQERKRIDNLLRACASLEPDLQPRLTIVGDGPARAGLERLAQQVYPKVVFAGAVHGPALEQYFSSADLFVLPGTGGLAVQQAMGHGLAVIAAEGDGTQNDLVRPENGWRLPPDDLPALQSALREALSDIERLHSMGRQSLQIVREEFNIEAMVAGFLDAVSRISNLR